MKLVFVSEFILNLKDVLVQPRGPLRFFVIAEFITITQ